MKSKFCYECGKQMTLVNSGSKRSHWECKCGHILPAKVNERHSSKASSPLSSAYMDAMKEIGFLKDSKLNIND
jgi:hypothetical protein